MKFILSSALMIIASIASAMVVPRQFCPEASRFGNLIVSSPNNATSYNPGDPIHIKVDLNCAINSFGIKPAFLDYTIQVLEQVNNGHEPPIVLARRTFSHHGATTDEFTTTILHWFYFANASYNILLTNTYPSQGTDGSQVLIQGGVESPIIINVQSS